MILQKLSHDRTNWYLCPNCGKKIIKYNRDAISKGVFLMCKKCGKEVEIKIDKSSN